MLLEKDGEDQLDRSYEKLECTAYSQVGEEYPTHRKKKEGWLNWSHLS
jgi:hypothetical protein